MYDLQIYDVRFIWLLEGIGLFAPLAIPDNENRTFARRANRT